MFCHTGPSSSVFFVVVVVVSFFAGCQILSDSDLQIKKKETETTLTMENCIVTQSKLLIGSAH